MSNNNEYWLYLDDSGKFLNKSDKHVIYGGIIFNNTNKIKYLDSKIYNCIQACDIITNFCNKYLNRHKDAKQLLNIFENFEFNIIACKFPVILYNNSILNIKCCWSEFGQVNTTKMKLLVCS